MKKRGTYINFFVWLDFQILFSSRKLRNFEWEWWKPETPNWCFQFLRYITQWQDCKFLTSVGPICVDGITSLSFFSHFFLFLSFSSFSLSLCFFFLFSFVWFFLSFFLWFSPVPPPPHRISGTHSKPKSKHNHHSNLRSLWSQASRFLLPPVLSSHRL